MDPAAWPSPASTLCPWAGCNLHHWTQQPFLLPLGFIPTRKPLLKHKPAYVPPLLYTLHKLFTHSEWLPESLLWPKRPCVVWSHVISLTSSSATLPLTPSSPATLSLMFFEHAILCTGLSLWTMHFCQKCSSPDIYRVPSLTSVRFIQMTSFQSGLFIATLSKIVDSPQHTLSPFPTLFFSLALIATWHFMYFAYVLGCPFLPPLKWDPQRAGVFLVWFGHCYVPSAENSSWYIIGAQ